MKLVQIALIATAASAQELGTDCSSADVTCDEGLCCGNAVLEGEATRRVCNEKDASTWLDEESGNEYSFSCGDDQTENSGSPQLVVS